jgi:UDP-GlcNAc:undecaprenyl-phosphate GlcNAc-1-phosphate transferase
VGPYGDYLIIFAVSVVGSYLFTFPATRLAVRMKAVAKPGDSHIHAKPTPVVGLGLLSGFLLAMLTAYFLPGLRQIFTNSLQPLGVVMAAVVIYLVGLIDDIRDISPPAKVAGQVLAAMFLVYLGVTMFYFKLPFLSGIYTLSPSILPLITALWVVGMTNAINIIDGLDGLAAGIVAIASAALAIYGFKLMAMGVLPGGVNDLGPLVAVMACGVAIGFLPHNFHPAKVFMGDSGAMLLGLFMAVSTMVIGGRTGGTAAVDVSGLTFFRFAPLFIPFFILGVPIVDTVFAILRRTIGRKGVATRDLGHLHHRLVSLGHGHRRAVLVLWAWTLVLSAFILYPVFNSKVNAYVPIGAGVLGVGLYTLFRPGFKKVAVNGSDLEAAAEDISGQDDVDGEPDRSHLDERYVTADHNVIQPSSSGIAIYQPTYNREYGLNVQSGAGEDSQVMG